MSEREAIARLYRRAGFGLAPGELDALERLGVDAVVDRLVDPAAHGIPPSPDDLWEDVELPLADSTEGSVRAVDRWIEHLLVTERPFEEWMAWYWHGHLVTSIADIAFVPRMTAQVNLFRRAGLGSFRALLREVTIDPGMLAYLDGEESTGDSPNENYAREMLELFSLGIGNYTEDDIAAGARALTGWRVRLVPTGSAVDPVRARSWFDPSAHDDTRHRYLGRDGVHDLDTVIDAACSQDACAPFVTRRFGTAVLGPDADAGLLRDLARRFRASDLDVRVLARGVLEAVAEGRVAGLVLGPFPWLLAAQRATGAHLEPRRRYWTLYDAGHLPMWPPNVGGWPGGPTWLASSTTAQRYNLAGEVATSTPEDNVARRAAADGDLEALADALGRPEGFRPSTVEALTELRGTAREDGGLALLTVALASPDLVLA